MLRQLRPEQMHKQISCFATRCNPMQQTGRKHVSAYSFANSFIPPYSTFFFGSLCVVRDRRPCKLSKTLLSHDYHLIFIPGLGCAHRQSGTQHSNTLAPQCSCSLFALFKPGVSISHRDRPLSPKRRFTTIKERRKEKKSNCMCDFCLSRCHLSAPCGNMENIHRTVNHWETTSCTDTCVNAYTCIRTRSVSQA